MTPRRRLARPERRRFLGAFGGAAALALRIPSARANGFDLAQLMQQLASVRSGSARFVERREVRMLDRTLVSSGRLAFEAPDTFVRETLEPRHERIAVSGNRVTLVQGGRSRSMQLDAAPEAAVIVEAIRGTLTGNRAALERLFTTTVSGTPERWTLLLVPREARLRGQVATVEVGGSGNRVEAVTVWLADGDRSMMTIEPARPAAGGSASGAAPAASAPARAAR